MSSAFPSAFEEALRLLACPVCHAPLRMAAAAEGPLVVRCSGCRRGYPVLDGIPVLIGSRAAP